MLPRVHVRAMGGALAVVVAAAVSLPAHHALNAEYDSNAPVTLVGRIVKVEWTNPHSFLEMACTAPDGALEQWRVEAGSPATLAKWKISREMLAIDTVVTVGGFRAKNGALRAWGAEITFADGVSRKLDDSMVQAVPDDLPPPTALERLMSSLPLLPYVVAAVPVVVLVAGLSLLRRRRARSVPQ